MKQDASIKAALAGAWHQQSASASLERWLDICRKEGWGSIPADQTLLIRIFGASWYFTRYIFYRGRDAALLLDTAEPQELNQDHMQQKIMQVKEINGMDNQLEQLRLLKNEIMLQILACSLAGRLDQAATEHALTGLAAATLAAILEIFELRSRPGARIAVYGMGRMAGGEMTFGSDLDLIFLFENNSQEEIHDRSRKIRLLMRNIAAAGSAGALYEIDMRLRPHGTSGALLTTAASFLEYHQSEREIWERQMMTRCKPVIDQHHLGRECLDRINPYIYSGYDVEYLRREIIAMRARVQEEKGNISGKFEVKRGPGGIMDIDFLTHFLQLSHGHDYQELRTGSTRTALKVLAENKFIRKKPAAGLLEAYDFLKNIEAGIRLFDMKPVSSFAERTEEHLPVAAAMGYCGDEAGRFVEKYKDLTAYVRAQFRTIVGDPSVAVK